jgi:predicted homoserine dehydrogenase-like protein
VAAGALVTWDDVAVDETTAAVRLRREMERDVPAGGVSAAQVG